MAYAKALLAGVAGACLALIATIALSTGWMLLQAWLATRGQEGSAGIGAVSVSVWIPGLAALIAVAAGFYFGFGWQLRRAARR
jgi:hypothetical protein